MSNDDLNERIELLTRERDALLHNLMVAIDYLVEAQSSTKQYDFDARARGFVERTQNFLKVRHDK